MGRKQAYRHYRARLRLVRQARQAESAELGDWPERKGARVVEGVWRSRSRRKAA